MILDLEWFGVIQKERREVVRVTVKITLAKRRCVSTDTFVSRRRIGGLVIDTGRGDNVDGVSDFPRLGRRSRKR